jgi:hypothetical protein
MDISEYVKSIHRHSDIVYTDKCGKNAMIGYNRDKYSYALSGIVDALLTECDLTVDERVDLSMKILREMAEIE